MKGVFRKWSKFMKALRAGSGLRELSGNIDGEGNEIHIQYVERYLANSQYHTFTVLCTRL